MDVPRTVRAALADRPVEGAVCLEAGAGFGNATAGLLDAGARRVYAVTTDPDHARFVRRRVRRDGTDDRTAVVEADVRRLPMADESVDVVTAHALFNLLAPSTLDAVARELTRVAAPGCHLVVDDYDPLPADAAMNRVFAVENAASELAAGRPAVTFYPAAVLARLFEGHGWTVDRERTLLDPVPWTVRHVAAHTDATRAAAATLPDAVADPLVAEAERVADEVGSESTGTMYSVALRL